MAGGKKHTVQQGECMSSLAFENGLFWETLWLEPENAALKESRDSAFVLEPGDVVHIPDLRPKTASVSTGARHTFRRKGVPAKVRLRLMVRHEPLANLPYVATCAGREVTGTTDADGRIELFVPPNVAAATLRVGEGEAMRVYRLSPRTLNPSRTIDGIQARLVSLGYYRGAINDQLDDATKAAIKRFQSDHDLEATGEPDDTTAKTLAAVHSGTS